MSHRYQLSDLLRVMERLRDPATGCPWDLRQDFQSIVPSTLEECYELAQALEHEDYEHAEEELGDVLFQVIFYAQLGRERELFSFESIVDGLVAKLVRRHPHVFRDGDIEGVVEQRASVDSVKHSWEAIKQEERQEKSRSGTLADVPLALPALPRAQKLQKRAARVGFDWADVPAVLVKLEEEIAELRAAMDAAHTRGIEAEMGDILFTGVNLARKLGLDAEAGLRLANSRFEQRFNCMEQLAAQSGSSLAECSEGELDLLWEEAKRLEQAAH